MWSYSVWDQIRRRPHLFEGSFAYFTTRLNLAAGGEAEMVDAYCVSGSFFRVLGIDAALGRTLSDEDDQRGGSPAAGPVAMIGYGFWQTHFGGAADVLGRNITVDGQRFSIVGVLPRTFSGPVVGRRSDVVIPVANVPRQGMLKNSGVNWLVIMARLKPGQSREAAAVALRAEQNSIREGAVLARTPGPSGQQRLTSPLMLLRASHGNEFAPLRRRFQQPLVAMQVIVAFVLLIACANVGNLMLARAAARRNEVSIRRALGASRSRLIRQSLIESGLLAALGAAGGLLVARWAGQALVPLLSTQNNLVSLTLTLNGRMLGFTTVVAIVSALLFGTIPALRASRTNAVDTLKEQGRGAAGARAGVAQGLVVAQVALSLVLMTGTGLFVRTFVNLATADLGFEPSGVLIVHMTAPVGEPMRATALDEIRRAVAVLPDVAGAATSMMTPVTGTAMEMPMAVVDAPPLPDGHNHVSGNAVSPGWFSIYRTSMVSGRDFTDADGKGSRPVAIVNTAFARRFLQGANPVGRIVRQAIAPPSGVPLDWEIVGMVEDTAYESLRMAMPPMIYHTFVQFEQMAHPSDVALSVRSTTVAPRALRRSVSAAIATVSPSMVLASRSLPEIVGDSIRQERSLAMLVGFFGALALLLSALGIYGVTAYSVARRRGELGIRMALGASPNALIRLVLRRVTLLLGTGILIGAAVTSWLAQFVAPLLYNLQPTDAVVMGTAAVTLVLVGSIAGWLPARRASRMVPIDSLRAQGLQ